MSDDEPSVPPVDGGGLGHPGHFSGQGYLVDVAAGPGGRLVAVGYAFPGWRATAWVSLDGERWARHDLDAGDGSFALSVAGDESRFVAVGSVGSSPAAWRSTDGETWQRAPDGPELSEDSEVRMATAAAVADRGFVAGGWAGPLGGPVSARFWASADGLAWRRVADDPGDAGNRVLSIASGPAGLVAVGSKGPAGDVTGSVAWTSPDGAAWSRAEEDAVLSSAGFAAVASADGGFVAVGSGLEERAAMSWVSPDGSVWKPSPAQATLDNHKLKIRMTDVVADDHRLVSVGNYLLGTQYGSATSWTSGDGLAWTRAPESPPLNQGEMLAVARSASGYVAVGTFGAPDNYVPTVWLGDAPDR